MFFTPATAIDPLLDRKKVQRAGKSCALALACVLAVMACAGAFDAAAADDYTVFSCSSEETSPLSTQAWTLHDGPLMPTEITSTPDCAAGALSLAIIPTAATGASAHYSFDAPAGTMISSYKLWRSLQVIPALDEDPPYRYRAFIRERVTPPIGPEVNADFGCASFAGDCLSLGSITDPFDLQSAGTEFTKQGAQNLSAVQMWVSCEVAVCGAFDGIAARSRLFRSQVTLADSSSPALGQPSGSLLIPGPASGSASLQIPATDIGGGIASAIARIDGATTKTWSAGASTPQCNLPYTAKVPCPLQANATFQFDTQLLSFGIHSVDGTITDAAGNVTPYGPALFQVDNTLPPVIPGPTPPVVTTQAANNGSPAVTTPLLTIKADSLVRPRGTNTAATGLLTTQSGAPIARAKLSVRSVQLATDMLAEQSLADVTTSSDGTFTIPVQSDGAQLLRVEFTPTSGAAVTASAGISVRTETAISLKTSKKKLKRGRKVTLRGSLLGAGPSAEGTTATIQAIVRGKWRPVGSATVGITGQFKWSYKFVALRRPTNFSFRAIVVRTPGWPWPTTSSSRLRVKVTL